MADTSNPLIAALRPLTSRVRTDVTAAKEVGEKHSTWRRVPLTDERLAQHLNGGPARGVCPIQAGESVTMVALLDFDSHGGETSWGEMAATAAGVADTLALAWGAPVVAFRSSGGRGVHLYLLWDEPQDAYSVRQWLREVLESCGLKSGTRGVANGEVEIFPKQDEVPLGGFGNQFILPLDGGSRVPPGRKSRGKRFRSGILQHSMHLFFEFARTAELPCGRQREEFLVWSCAPEKIGQPRSQLQITD